MSQPYVGEIALNSFNFAPKGWALCAGQLLSIAQNQALFAILGTQFGGNGTTNFALPDFRGRTGMSVSNNTTVGAVQGTENVTLSTQQIPSHNHLINAYSVASDSHTPQGNVLGRTLANGTALYSDQSADTWMSNGAIGVTGGSQPHQNMQPYLVVNFCIALVGIFPSRN